MRKNKFYSAFFLFFLLAQISIAQIVINEVCPKNSAIIKDEDGDFEDWIEIYNSSGFPVNLSGYFLSDDFANLPQWQFPSFTLQPQQYFLVFASGKNRKRIIDHWETAVNATDVWKYKVPSSQPPSNWNTTAFNDVAWSQGSGGLGFGDNDDVTQLSSPMYSVFMRKTFTIPDTSKIAVASVTIDYDDAFVAYLNGVEIARSNIGITGTPPSYNDLAIKEHEALFYQGQTPANFNVEPEILKTAMKNGTNVFSVQVHNVSYGSSDFSAIPFLHFGMKDNTVFFPAPPSWFDGGISSLHTNFKLSGDGESVYLSNSSQTIISQLTYPYLQNDNSYGSFPDGNASASYFEVPTPDSTNNYSAAMNGYTADPVFSLSPGYYTPGQSLSITCTTPSASIRYTVDGSYPKSTSSLYTAPLYIDSTLVVRARAFSSGALPSDVMANTYFINDSSTLPVFSLITDPSLLFDWNSGIYVMGPNADSVKPFFGANFWQAWEIPAHIEFFDKQHQLCLDQGVGIEIHGNYSRSFPQKSFKIIARGNLGKGSLDYPFFARKEISSYEQIVIRNAGNDWNDLHLRDAAIHRVCLGNTKLDVQDNQPCLLYINGKYWGVYDLREKINKDYIAANNNVDPGNIDILQYNGLVMSGDADNFEQFADFVIVSDFSDSATYESMKTKLDIDNFIDYFVVETYAENGDWLTNNVRFWREKKPDAKWKHILWDLDFFATTWWPFSANSLDTNLHKAYSFHSVMFNKLWQNMEFRNNFINRYADLLNTIFVPAQIKSVIYSMHDSLKSEMARHFLRWGKDYNEPAFGLPGKGTFNLWKGNNLTYKMTSFLNYRQGTARSHLEQVAGLKKQVPISFNVYPPGAGRIELNTIELDSFPWGGIYFDSVPITFKAIPNPGYEFAFWQSNSLIPNPDFNASITLNTDTTDFFTAFFFGSPDSNRICINEINYKSSDSSDAGDWVELYNYGTSDVDLSGWKFKDEVVSNYYIFPQNTVLSPSDFLVISRDTIKFNTVYPGINKISGPFSFGLSSSGSTLRLFDKYGVQYFSMTYGTAAPWPLEPNGAGKTLELLDVNGDFNDPYNWFAGCAGGSPAAAFTPCALGINEQEKTANSSLNLINYPNPFSSGTTISFQLSKEDFVNLIVVDVYGKKVNNLLNKKMGKGVHKVDFTPDKISQGIYFYQVKTSDKSETKLMHLIR